MSYPLPGAPSPPLTPPLPHQIKVMAVHSSIDSTSPTEATYDETDSFALIYDKPSSTTFVVIALKPRATPENTNMSAPSSHVDILAGKDTTFNSVPCNIFCVKR
jgi:hypothetical protein